MKNGQNEHTAKNTYAVTKTQRGFRICEFLDADGNQCSIQESSIATEECLWLGVDAIFSVAAPSRMHLNSQGVYEVLSFLEQFAEGGEEPSPSTFSDRNGAGCLLGISDDTDVAVVGMNERNSEEARKTEGSPSCMLVDKPLAKALIKLLRYFDSNSHLPDSIDDASEEEESEDPITTQTLYGKVHFDDRATSLAVRTAARDIHYGLIDLNADKDMSTVGYNQARDFIINELAKLVGQLKG